MNDPDPHPEQRPTTHRMRAAGWVLAGGIAAAYLCLKPLQWLSFESRLLGTGLYHNLCWRLSRGLGSWSDVLDQDLFGEHFNPIVIAIAALYKLWPSAHVLLLTQGLAAGLTVLGVWKYTQPLRESRGRKPAWAPLLWGVWILAALAYRPLHAAWFGDFQPITLGMPMVVFALIALREQRYRTLWLWALLLLTTQQAAPLTLLGLGLVAGFQYRRWRLALALAAVAGIAAVLAFGLTMTDFRGLHGPGSWHQAQRAGPLNDWSAKGQYLVLLLIPLAGLPLLGWRVAIGCLPGAAFNLWTDTGNQYRLNHHYDAQLAVFLLIGSAHGLFRFTAWTRSRAPQTGGPPRVVYLSLGVWGLWITAFAGPTLLTAAQRWWPTEQDRALKLAVQQVIKQHPQQPFAGDDVVGPRLCASESFVAIKVDRRAVTDDTYPYLRRLVPGQVIVLAKRSYDHGENLSLLMATGRVRVLSRGEQLTSLQWEAAETPAR